MKGNQADAPKIAYMKGRQAARIMKGLEDNPYCPCCKELHRQWDNGWMTVMKPGVPEGRPKKT